MIEKTKGIVVKTTKYSESSLVVKVFTEVFGMRTYMIRGVRKKNSKTPLNLFQPLSIIDMVVYEKTGRDLQNTKEIKAAHIYTSIPYEIKKSTIISFLNELLYKAIKEEETNINLFQFICDSLLFLDKASTNYQNFHLSFMLKLSQYLGFKPSDNFTANQEIFDLQEGRYTSLKLSTQVSIHPPLSSLFFQLSKDQSFGENLPINRKERHDLLEKILHYYEFHLPGFSELKSLSILKEVLE